MITLLKKNPLAFAIAAFAIIALIFNENIAHLFVDEPNTPLTLTKPLATVVKIDGPATRKNPREPQPEPLNPKQALYHLDFLQAPKNSSLTIQFETGGQVQLHNGSKSILQWADRPVRHVLIHLISGKIDVLKKAPKKKLLMAYYAGKLTDLGEGPENTVKKTSKESLSKKPNELKRDEVRRVMAGNRNLFDKCYAGLLKNNPKATGKVDMYFEVLPSGSVKVARVHKSDIKNQLFANCLSQTISRSRFSQFDGAVKKVIFPLQFGMN